MSLRQIEAAIVRQRTLDELLDSRLVATPSEPTDLAEQNPDLTACPWKQIPEILNRFFLAIARLL